MNTSNSENILKANEVCIKPFKPEIFFEPPNKEIAGRRIVREIHIIVREVYRTVPFDDKKSKKSGKKK